MNQLADYVGHKLLGQAYPINGNSHPSQAVVAKVTGVDGDSLVIRVEDDDLITTTKVSPLYPDALGFGQTPLLGEGTGEEYDEEWEFELDFWE